jgi:hypothetical protein
MPTVSSALGAGKQMREHFRLRRKDEWMIKTTEPISKRQRSVRTTVPPQRAHHANCPACDRQDTLYVTADGMMLCTHCFWATEMTPTN